MKSGSSTKDSLKASELDRWSLSPFLALTLWVYKSSGKLVFKILEYMLMIFMSSYFSGYNLTDYLTSEVLGTQFLRSNFDKQ